MTVTGPTTYRATLTGNDEYPTLTHLLLRPQVSTFNFTLAVNSGGSSVLDIPVGSSRTQTTITGPTTWIASLIAKYPVSAEVYAGGDSKDPHCNQSMSFEPAHLSTFVKYVTALSESQIWSTYMDDHREKNYAALAFIRYCCCGKRKAKISAHFRIHVIAHRRRRPRIYPLPLRDQQPYMKPSQPYSLKVGQIYNSLQVL